MAVGLRKGKGKKQGAFGGNVYLGDWEDTVPQHLPSNLHSSAGGLALCQ